MGKVTFCNDAQRFGCTSSNESELTQSKVKS